METKKSFKADLRNKRSLLLEIGLVAALALVIAAFSYTPDEYRIRKVTVTENPVEVDIIDVTKHEPRQEPARKIEVKIVSDILKVIDNDQKIQTDLDFTDFDPEALVLPTAAPVIEENPEEDVFISVETMPSFRGGDLNTFRQWVMQNVRFPQIALENEIYGRVVLSFVIDKQGNLTDIEVLRSPDRSLADEAIRVLKQSPRWSPGKQRNQTVNVRYTLPVEFRMQH